MTTTGSGSRSAAAGVALRVGLATVVATALIAGGTLIYHHRVGVGPAVATDQVVLDLNDFRPDAVTVPTGTTITWHWDGEVTHDLVFEDGVSGPRQKEGTYQRRFDVAGDYPYRCTLHGPMRGQVTVTDPTA